ncbi:MAG: hypothetical protein KA118_03810 [Verrucomicrobia bacterium]|nr:hypothetical protein [Verrucomicrobiota bacterium]
MENTNVSNEQKFTKLEITPKPSVRVYHTPNAGRDYYTLSYYDEEGRRQRRLFPDQQSAEAEAEKLGKKLEKREMPGLMLNGRERLIYERALAAVRPTGLDLDILVMDAVAARTTLKGVPLTEAARFHVEHTASVISRTVAEVVEELVSDRTKNGRSPAYIRDLRTRLGNFAEAFKCPIASVGTKDIEAYLDSTGAQGHYRKNIRDAIGTLFNFARKRGYVPKDHDGVAAISKPNLIPREVRVFTPEEFEKLLTSVPARLVPVLAIGGFTAIRTAEIERLDWSRINLREGHIEILARTAKKKVRRLPPISPNLKQWLKPFQKEAGPVSPFARLGNQWNKFADRVGVQWSKNVLRDSGISYRVAYTGDINLVALESGNSVDIIKSNYLKCVTKAAAKKWFAIRPPKNWTPTLDQEPDPANGS